MLSGELPCSYAFQQDGQIVPTFSHTTVGSMSGLSENVIKLRLSNKYNFRSNVVLLLTCSINYMYVIKNLT